MQPTKAIKIFYCCSDSNIDEKMLQELNKQLNILQQQGFITTWHKGMISAGKEWEEEIYRQLMTADIILPLISSDFFVLDYNWKVVAKQAMKRHKDGKARVIPILLRPTIDNWKVVFGNIKALPEGEKPVTQYRPYEKAFKEIAQSIQNAVEELTASPFSLKSHPDIEAGVAAMGRSMIALKALTVSLLTKKAKARRRNRGNLNPVLTSIVIVTIGGGSILINQLPHISGIPLLVPNLTLSSTRNLTPIGWIRIGVVSNISGSLSAGEKLLQSSNPRLASSIDTPVVPSIGAVVTVNNPVNLREKRPQTYLPDTLGLLKPGEKLIILKVKPLVIHDPNLPRMEVWAEVGRCDHTCAR